MKILSDKTSGRDNHFNLIRMIAATAVILGHCYPLTGLPHKGIYPGLGIGQISVDIFFVLSGFLVAGSLLNRCSLLKFSKARVLRIFPGLFVAVLFCAFVVGPYFTRLPIGEYFSDKMVYWFVVNNTLLFIFPVQYYLPGVFENNPFEFAVNGSLWTLPFEIKMYLLLLGLGFLFIPKQAPLDKRWIGWLCLLLVVFFTWKWVSIYLSSNHTMNHLYRFGGLFFTGSTIWFFRHRIPINRYVFIVVCSIIFFAWQSEEWFVVLYTLLIGYVVIYLGYLPLKPLLAYNHLGDYSYGVYIYAFPVQQGLVFLQPEITVIGMFLQAFCISLLLAIFSWHVVEKPMLRMK